MAWDLGVKIELLDCEYTRKSFEPYEPYMQNFEKLKNEADEKLKKAKADLEDAERLDASVEVPQGKAALGKEIANMEFYSRAKQAFPGGPHRPKRHVSR